MSLRFCVIAVFPPLNATFTSSTSAHQVGVLEKRLESSMTLLRGTEKSISAIVLECGFVDMSHCSKLFKSKFGVTPSTFRKSSNF